MKFMIRYCESAQSQFVATMLLTGLKSKLIDSILLFKRSHAIQFTR